MRLPGGRELQGAEKQEEKVILEQSNVMHKNLEGSRLQCARSQPPVTVWQLMCKRMRGFGTRKRDGDNNIHLFNTSHTAMLGLA